MPLQSSYPPSASAKMQTLQLPVSFATGEPVDRAIIATVASANPSASPAVPSLSQHTVRDRAVTRAGLRRSRRNVFPPPLPSLLYDRPVLKSFKSGGRFLLKKVTAASQSLFRSTRKDGRLRLELIASPSCEDPEDHCLAQSGGPANSVPRTVSSITLRPGRHLLPPHRHCYISTPYPSKWSCDQKSLYPQALADLVRSDTTHGCPLLHIPKSHQHAFSSSSSPTQCLTSSMSVVESPVQKEIETALSRHTGTISTPRFFAFVNLFSLGLGLIILEFVQVKRGVAFALQGVHMIKSLGLPCGMNWISPTDHLLSNASSTADAEMPIPQLAIPL
ncbi:hypothetical protein KP509_04G098400 [Ceratopteris richardii]|uniref:FAF domain-containing protein n=1 Tax=Ceratopteris richardii TaxID=49495 RepID=A0A8T2V371_CERRI|nr:hypothetical protein KP509_04G098400 [Ceratopteris richardii]